VSESRKLAAILVSDVVGYSRRAGADEDRILGAAAGATKRPNYPTIAVHHGRVVKRTGDGSIIEFRSVVDAVNCAVEAASDADGASRHLHQRSLYFPWSTSVRVGLLPGRRPRSSIAPSRRRRRTWPVYDSPHTIDPSSSTD
jgi:class 3 adenylate cyclase